MPRKKKQKSLDFQSLVQISPPPAITIVHLAAEVEKVWDYLSTKTHSGDIIISCNNDADTQYLQEVSLHIRSLLDTFFQNHYGADNEA